MKWCFFVLILHLTSFTYTTAQDEIEGLGKFKIGKTRISIMQAISEESGDEIKRIDSYYSLGNERLRVGELVPNEADIDDSPVKASFCPSARVFLINTYSISGIQIENIYLMFKDSILVSISCDNSIELEEALKIKYGSPEPTIKRKVAICSGLPVEETTQTRRWVNGGIVATSYQRIYYNTRCEEQLTDYFWIRNTSLTSVVDACSDKVKAQRIATKQQQKRKSLKDF